MTRPERNKQGTNQADLVPRRNRAGPVAQETPVLATAAFARKGFDDPALVLHWDEIAGPDVARIARPIRFSEGAEGGTLTLKAEPGAALFLQHETRSLCQRINTYLGRSAVVRLRFVHGPLVERTRCAVAVSGSGVIGPGDPSLAFRGPEPLRGALAALARRRNRAAD